MSKNEMLIAGGVVAVGLAYYLFFADDAAAAAPPPRQPGPFPNVPGPGPAPANVFVSTRCPSIESDLPDEYKQHVDGLIAANLSTAQYADWAQQYADQGWLAASACLSAAKMKAAAKEGLVEVVPGGHAIDQTKTCPYWVQQYSFYKGKVDAIKAGLADANWIAANPNWNADLQNAASGLTMARNAVVQLGGCGIPLT